MTRTVTVEIFKLDELPARMQERVIARWRDGIGYEFPWGSEYRASLDAFETLAPVRVKDWSIGYPRTYVRHEMAGRYAEEIGDLSGVRAWKWLHSNGWAALANPPEGKSCLFTGFCADEYLLDPIRAALANPASIGTLCALFGDCLHSWAKAYEADIDYHYSDEAIREDIEANEHEFYADGRLA